MGKPRGGKKKNAGVGVDFKKVKHKVGKKLPRAQNATDTNFKSRTISLAEQSVAVDKEGQAVTQRNLTLKDVVGQCSHYSERVRKDALQGLAELLAGHPDELRRHTTLVMETAAQRITDGDKAVRAALRDLLSATLLPALGGQALAPFVPLLMAHVCAAMTHLSEAIRADALGFLELLMSARPDVVASGFLTPVLQHFSDLLSKGHRGKSIKAGSLGNLHGVAVALERFLSKATAALAAGGGGSGAGSGGGSAAVTGSNGSGGKAAGGEGDARHAAAAGGGAAGVLMWRRCQWPPAGAGAGAGASSGQPPLVAAAAEGSGLAAVFAAGGAARSQADVEGVAAAAALLGHLLDCWSEAGPSQLAEAPELVAGQCLTAILRSCDLLLAHYGADVAGSTHDRASLASALLKKVSPYFPVHRPAVNLPAPVSDQLVQLNVAAAQLLARFLQEQQAAAAAAATTAAAAAGGGDGGMGSSGEGVSELPWVERLLDWFAGVMAEGSALPASEETMFGEAPASQGAAAAGGSGSGGGSKRKRGGGGGGGGGGSAALPGSVYQSALDGSLLVLPLLPLPRRQQLLGAAWQLWQRTSARSGSRARVLAFWQSLLSNPTAAFYQPVPGGGPLMQHADVAPWLAALPRFLFELGSHSPATSRAALLCLLGAARCAPLGSELAEALQGLQRQLAPLFVVLLPAGKAAGAQQGQQQGAARVHVGPLAALPPAIQELAVDLLYHFPAASDQLLRTAALVCLGDAYPTPTAARLLAVLSAKSASGAASDPAAFCGLLLNVLSGTSLAGPRQLSWARHEVLVETACQAALGLGAPAEVAALLLPPLLSAAANGKEVGGGGSQSDAWAAYGLLQLCTALATAAAASQQQWEAPEAVVAALPGLMLTLQSSCCQQLQPQQAQQAQQAQQELAAAAGVSSSIAGVPGLTSEQATGHCLRLLVLQPQPLVPRLLSAVAGALQDAPHGAAAATASSNPSGTLGSSDSLLPAALLPVALLQLQALLREPRLRECLLDEKEAVHAALTACKAASEAAGGATVGTRGSQEQLRQLEATAAALLGSA